MGTGVPQALRSVGLGAHVRWVRGVFHGSAADTEWLARVGQEGWLALSRNKKILSVPHERETLIRSKVGIVFLTSGQVYRPHVLRLVLQKWDWLEYIDEHTPRPFAYYLYPSGRTRQIDLSSFD